MTRSDVVGVDVGATRIKGAVVNTVRGRLCAQRREVPTPVPSTPSAIADAVAELVAPWSCPGPIGVALPCITRSGVTRSAANIHPSWIDTNASELFSTTLPHRQVAVLNDADAAGIAEGRFGAARVPTGTVLVLIFGTGLGSALLVDGEPVPHTEFGQVLIDGTVAERLVAASVRRRERLSWPEWSTRVNRLLRIIEFDMKIRLDLIVIGGGVSCAASRWRQLLSAGAPIVPADLGKNSGIVGAAIAAVDQLRFGKLWVTSERNFGTHGFPPLFGAAHLFPDDFRNLCLGAHGYSTERTYQAGMICMQGVDDLLPTGAVESDVDRFASTPA